jgi:phage-related protein
MVQRTRPISWIKAARKEFETFPIGARNRIQDALTVAAEGRKADIAKPLTGLGTGVLEIAVRYRTDAYRAVYAVQIAEEIWVIHTFQKKSTIGIKTSKKDIDLIRQRLKQLKELMR